MTSDTQAWRERFAVLVNDYQQVFGARSTLKLPDDGDVSLEASWRGVEFTFRHSITSSPAHLLIRCRFGKVPSNNAYAVLLRLLQIQRTLTPSAASMLGIDAADGQVSHVQVLPLADAGLPQLLAMMEQMMLRATEWRESYFLDEEDVTGDEGELASNEPPTQTH